MGLGKLLGAFVAAAMVAYVAAVAFISENVISEQIAVGGVYTVQQELEAFGLNLIGLAARGYGPVLAIGLLLAFVAAAMIKRVLRPLAPIVYPVAGAAAVLSVLLLIDRFMAPPGIGGAIPGARSSLEIGLQSLAGALGGIAFELLRPRRATRARA
jgi:hypothetical protein